MRTQTAPLSPYQQAPMGSATPLLLVAAGAAWGLWYFGMNLVGWGEPGTSAYARYEAYNRAAPAVLLLLLAATLASRRRLRALYQRAGGAGGFIASAGLAVMAAGSALEFWTFTEESYSVGSLRGYGWSTYCAGLLLFYVGTVLVGFALRRAAGFRAAGVLLMIWLPAAALFSAAGSLAGVSVPAFSLAVALCGAAYVIVGCRLWAGRPAAPLG